MVKLLVLEMLIVRAMFLVMDQLKMLIPKN
jgi:hypothetical protein